MSYRFPVPIHCFRYLQSLMGLLRGKKTSLNKGAKYQFVGNIFFLLKKKHSLVLRDISGSSLKWWSSLCCVWIRQCPPISRETNQCRCLTSAADGNSNTPTNIDYPRDKDQVKVVKQWKIIFVIEQTTY